MSPEITPIKVEKKKPTGTKELSTIARSLDNIHDGMTKFMETVARTDIKENEIASRLCDLTEAIKENGDPADPEIKEILEDLDNRIFEETFYTEKGSGNNGAIRMTDDTKFKHMRAFAAEAAKVSAAKFKMSAGDYTPNATIIAKLQASFAIFEKTAKEHIGPVAGAKVVAEAMEDIVEVWDE